MSLETLGNLGDFVGGIAVVVTLIYVAIQIRDNTAQVRMNTAAAQWSGTLHAWDAVYGGRNSEVLRLGGEDPEQLDDGERYVWSLLMTRLVGQAETAHYHREHGALDPEVFAMHERILGILLLSPGGRSWWETSAAIFTHRFRAFVDELLENPPPALVEALEAVGRG